MAGIAFTPQLFIFEVVTQLIVIVSIVVGYIKTRELYQLSLHKGIKYLSIAVLFYLLGFIVRIVSVFMNFITDGIYGTFEATPFGLVLVLLNMYVSLLGGFFLAYCLVWKLVEKEQIKKRNLGGMAVLYILALIIVTSDIYLMVAYKIKTPFLFFGSAIGILLYAIIVNSRYCCRMRKPSKDLNPFLSLVGLGLGIYIVLLAESLLISFLFTIHYYVWGLAMVFALAFVYHIIKLSG